MQSSDNATVQARQLAQELDAIQELDRFRLRFQELRESGLANLYDIVAGDKQFKAFWIDEDDEPKDLVKPALIYLAASRGWAREE